MLKRAVVIFLFVLKMASAVFLVEQERGDITNLTMSKRTVLNDNYKGLVEAFSIPAEIHEKDGKKFATFGSVIPIHCCDPDQVADLSSLTHHYCDIFTQSVLMPLGELAYVRLDEDTAEKVFINRHKRILLLSSDGKLAQWRCAPTFESGNHFIAGTPIVDRDGALISVITAKRGKHYAVSNIDGDGGYVETPHAWKVLDLPEGVSVYGDKTFTSRDDLRKYVEELSPVDVGPNAQLSVLLWRGSRPRLVILAQNGRQLSHHHLQGVLTTDIEYL